ncbi:hypothetical protein NDU88_005325 [Pleurodeles waltl]|uniref:Uncharacterized protein n=1 Tax=Pleurodeles waltl TaxID=8319 RepID=A0AAV7WY77_PLEWA|nr:hypothetical protein NDU88_005325 [Pleurodeles waltl]
MFPSFRPPEFLRACGLPLDRPFVVPEIGTAPGCPLPSSDKARQLCSMPTGRSASRGRHKLPPLCCQLSASRKQALTTPVWHAFLCCNQRSPPALTPSQAPRFTCRSDSRVRRLPVKRSCLADLFTVGAAGFPRGAILAPIAPRGQETVHSHCVRAHNDRPICDPYL